MVRSLTMLIAGTPYRASNAGLSMSRRGVTGMALLSSLSGRRRAVVYVGDWLDSKQREARGEWGIPRTIRWGGHGEGRRQRATSSVRLRAFSLRSTAPTCFSTVFTEMPRRLAICLSARPWMSSDRTSSSRWVSVVPVGVRLSCSSRPRRPARPRVPRRAPRVPGRWRRHRGYETADALRGPHLDIRLGGGIVDQPDDGDLGVEVAQDGQQARLAGESEAGDDDVRVEQRDGVDGGRHVGGLGHDLDAGLARVEQLHQAGAHRGLVVGDDDAEADRSARRLSCCSYGRSARMRVPQPGVESIWTRPPT